ncbi:PAS domain S-box protein, partial [bacterium]|nr:PAS domain S-box protein [bacterium]
MKLTTVLIFLTKRYTFGENCCIRKIEDQIIIRSMILDITSDHNLYESLRSEHKKFKRIFESIQDAYIVLDLNGTIKEFNNKTVSLLGFNSEEDLALANFFTDIVSDERQRSQFQKVLETSHEVYELELEMRKADGSPIYTHCSLHYIYGDFFKPVSIEGFIRDISSQKLQEIKKNLAANGDNLLTTISAHFLNKEFQEAMEFGLKNLGTFLEVEHLSFAQVDLKNNCLDSLYEWHKYQDISRQKSMFLQREIEDNTLIPQSVLEGKEFFVTDLEHHRSNACNRKLLKAGCKSIAVIPSKSSDVVKGILFSTTSNPYHLFSGEEVRILRTFSEYATNSLIRSETRQELIRSQNSLKI